MMRVARKEGLSMLGLNRNSVLDKETFECLSNEGTSNECYPCLDQNGALEVMSPQVEQPFRHSETALIVVQSEWWLN